LAHQAADTLIKLDPLLETVLADDHERLRTEKAEIAISQVKNLRFVNLMQALIALGDILKLIRNKRAHGFKTRSGPLDQEILSSARTILDRLFKIALAILQKSDFKVDK
jgi:hypothetical protein